METRTEHKSRYHPALVVGMIVVLYAAAAAAAGDVVRGRQHAATWCSSCHQICPGFPVHGPGPSFMSIAGNSRYSKAYITDWVSYPHTTMPHFRFSPQVLDDLVSYIHSLRPTATAECVPCGASPTGSRFSTGTGFFISGDGHVVTVNHILRACIRTTIQMPGRTQVAAQIISTDGSLDLALLKIKNRPDSYAHLGGDLDLRLGDRVVSFSFPLSQTLSSFGVLTTGHIAALFGIGDDRDEFQMSANLQPGSSGGPVLDEWGRVIGVAKSRLVATSEGDAPPQGVNFAVSTGALRLFLAASGQSKLPSPRGQSLPLAEIGAIARSFTVRVTCWR